MLPAALQQTTTMHATLSHAVDGHFHHHHHDYHLYVHATDALHNTLDLLPICALYCLSCTTRDLNNVLQMSHSISMYPSEPLLLWENLYLALSALDLPWPSLAALLTFGGTLSIALLHSSTALLQSCPATSFLGPSSEDSWSCAKTCIGSGRWLLKAAVLISMIADTACCYLGLHAFL